MDEENGKPETHDQRLSRQASEYWRRLAAKPSGDSNWPEQNQRQPRQTEMPESTSPLPDIDPQETDPVILILDALRKSTDANQAALAEARATRQDIAESDRQAKRLADTAANNMRMLNMAVENLTAGKNEIDRLKAQNLIWAAAGFVAGMILLEIGILTWQHMFG